MYPVTRAAEKKLRRLVAEFILQKTKLLVADEPPSSQSYFIQYKLDDPSGKQWENFEGADVHRDLPNGVVPTAPCRTKDITVGITLYGEGWVYYVNGGCYKSNSGSMLTHLNCQNTDHGVVNKGCCQKLG